jgi:hypothetical protein
MRTIKSGLYMISLRMPVFPAADMCSKVVLASHGEITYLPQVLEDHK